MAVSNKKFIDRSPSILPAGKRSDSQGDSVFACLKEYKIDDSIAALESYTQKKAPSPQFKVEPYQNRARKGIFTDMQRILQPGVKTRYQHLINELKETPYASQWNKCVGATRDPIPGLPRGLNKEETTFGVPSNRDESVKELVNPPKGVYQVLEDSQVGHEMYRRTHNDYNPGEMVNRNYLSPPYEEGRRFGAKTKYDPRGIWVRCACHWRNSVEPMMCATDIQADFRNSRQLLEVPKGLVFGRRSDPELYNVEMLMKDADCPPCQLKRDLKCWLASFNKLRVVLKQRSNKGLCFDDLYNRMLYYDGEKSGWLPLEVFYEVSLCFGIRYCRENFEPLLTLLKEYLSVVGKNCGIKGKRDFSFYTTKRQNLTQFQLYHLNPYGPPYKSRLEAVRTVYKYQNPFLLSEKRQKQIINSITSKKVKPLKYVYLVLSKGKINYGAVLDFLDYQKPPLELHKIQDIPPNHQYYISSTQCGFLDYLIQDNTACGPAGVPSIRTDMPRPIVPPGRPRADLENLGEATTVQALLEPCISQHYGLNFRDFLMPRDAATLRRLFQKVGYQLDDQVFDKLWKLGVEQDKTGSVCVDTFNKLVKSHCDTVKSKLVVDEATC